MLRLTQKEIELEISQLLESGDITAISNLSGIGYSYIDQQLNPNDARRSCITDALRVVCALDEHAPERGEALWQLMARIREASKPVTADALSACADARAGRFAKESGEALQARFSGRTKLEQLAEAVEAETAARKYKESIIAEINAEKEQTGIRRNTLKAV